MKTKTCCNDLEDMLERGLFYEYEYGNPTKVNIAMRLVNRKLLSLVTSELKKRRNLEQEDVTIGFCPFCGQKLSSNTFSLYLSSLSRFDNMYLKSNSDRTHVM